MRKAFVALGVVGLAAVVLASFSLRRAPARRPQDEASAQRTDRSDELAELRREMATLKRMSAAQTVRAPAPATEAQRPREEAKPSIARLPPAEQKRLLTEALETQYGREGVDATWSPARVTEIKTAFGALPDVTVVAAECASTLCRVLVQHADADSQGSLMERTAETEGLGTQTIYLFDKEATPPRTTLYIARAGHRLPSPRL